MNLARDENKLLFRLRTKITGLVLFVVILMMATTSYFNLQQDVNNRLQAKEDQMTGLARAIASVGTLEESQNWEVFQDYIDVIYTALDDIVYIAIFDRGDSLVASVLNEDMVEFPQGVSVSDSVINEAILDLDQGRLNPVSEGDFDLVQTRIRSHDETIGRVRLGYSKIVLNSDTIVIRNRNFIVLAIFLAFGFMASLMLSGRLTKPLITLSTAMETVPHGTQDQIVHIKSRDEIGVLARSFNYMVKTLREREFFDKFERDLSTVFTLEKIFSVLLGRLQYLYQIKRGALVIFSNEKEGYSCQQKQNFDFELDSDFYKKLHDALEDHLKKDEICFSLEGMRIIAREIPALRNAIPVFEENKVHWIIFLQRQDTTLGLILLGKDDDDFTVNIEEKKYIVNLVRHTLLPIENALLYSDQTEKERLKKELEIAHTVQMNLLPQKNPIVDGMDLFGVCRPAREVGGDYFDYVEVDEDRIGIVVADVSGKGTSASFYMAEIKGMIVSLSTLYSSPKELLKILNRRLYMNMERKIFATMIYGILDKRTGEFIFSRAGHNPVIVKNFEKNEVRYVTPRGIGLGLDQGNIFDGVISEEKIILEKGDVILLYTDGVTEAMNTSHSEFGEDRLKEIILNQNNANAELGCKQIIDEVNSFSSGAEQFDDMTLVMIKANL